MKTLKDARRLQLGAALISALMLGTSAHAQIAALEADNPAPQIVPIPSFKPALPAHEAISADDLYRMAGVISSQASRLDEQDRRLESQDRVIQTLLEQVQALREKTGSTAETVSAENAEATVVEAQVRATATSEPVAGDTAAGENELDSIRAGGLPERSAPAAGTAFVLPAPAQTAASLPVTPPSTQSFIVAQQQPQPTTQQPRPVQQTQQSPRPATQGQTTQTAAAAPAAQAPAAAQQPPRPAAAAAAPAAQGQQAAPAAQQAPPPAPGMLPTRPVGEAPPEMEMRQEVIALPEGARVLTPVGTLVLESSIEYGRTSSNRLVFRGVEIVPGIQLGLVDANEVARDTVVGTASARYGIWDRFELSGRLPFIYRHDRLTILSQQVANNSPGATQTRKLEGRAVGDVELGVRYQLNRGATPNSAVYVGGLTLKTPTGVGPYDVDFDAQGIATELGTGSGFWAVSPSLSILFPSDPVVLFANIGYLHSIAENVNKMVGTTPIGRVSPGDSISFGMGFGFALNPQFSFSLGFGNSYLFPTTTTLGNVKVKSNAAEVAILTMGWSYVFTPRFVLSSNFEFGVTSDAPDMRMSFRFPLSLF